MTRALVRTAFWTVVVLAVAVVAAALIRRGADQTDTWCRHASPAQRAASSTCSGLQ